MVGEVLAADGNDLVTYLYGSGGAKGSDYQLIQQGITGFKQGDVGTRVGADDSRRSPRHLITERDLNTPGIFNHVIIRENMAGLINHEA